MKNAYYVEIVLFVEGCVNNKIQADPQSLVQHRGPGKGQVKVKRIYFTRFNSIYLNLYLLT